MDAKICFNKVFTRCRFVTQNGSSVWYPIQYSDSYPYIGYIVVKNACTGNNSSLVVRVAGQPEDLTRLSACN